MLDTMLIDSALHSLSEAYDILFLDGSDIETADRILNVINELIDIKGGQSEKDKDEDE